MIPLAILLSTAVVAWCRKRGYLRQRSDRAQARSE